MAFLSKVQILPLPSWLHVTCIPSDIRPHKNDSHFKRVGLIPGGTEFWMEQRLKNTLRQDSGLGSLWPHSSDWNVRVRRAKKMSHCMTIVMILFYKSLFLNVQQAPRQASYRWQEMLWQGIQMLKQEWNEGSPVPQSREQLTFCQIS